jgi:hypothetical protein
MSPCGFSTFPSKPYQPSGKTRGKVNESYEYHTSAIDQQHHQLFYWFDWGDGTYSDWIGPYASGEICSALHRWEINGNYHIRVKVKNEKGTVSVWSDPLAIIIPKNKIATIPFFQFHYQHLKLFQLFRVLFYI